MKSTPTYEYPMICVREILANAVCHRNYEDAERLTYVTIYNNRIEIKSPGTWCSTPIAIGKAVSLTNLVSESVQRNMRLAHAISSVGVVEVEGSGIPTAINDCKNSGAPEPLVEQRDGYVIVTIYPRDDWEADIEEGSIGQQDPFAEPTVALTQLNDQSQNSSTEFSGEADTSKVLRPIVGRSDAIKRVLSQIAQVAPTDTSVLISGETGTGKELVAQAIHSFSSRRDKPLIKLNCAALPSALIESELFGHERGAFTGARSARQGHFELAHGGTIFLDEIAELPLSSQVKLLRVIQEGEIRRIGGTRTINVDVRIIAASNRDLNKAVENGEFRRDLWYRLNVYPIHVPPLRNRRDDIPLLTEFFVTEMSKRFGKAITAVSSSTMSLLENYSWPGNVRELENVLERAVILATDPILHVDQDLDVSRPTKTLEEVERDHIIKVLNDTNWQIEGKNGAASILGLHRTSLRNRMRKLAITKQSTIQDSDDAELPKSQ
jgi:transcriptional regulator with GAF, ATPase, and Fis domain